MDKEDGIAQLVARIAALEKHVIGASRNAADAVWAGYETYVVRI